MASQKTHQAATPSSGQSHRLATRYPQPLPVKKHQGRESVRAAAAGEAERCREVLPSDPPQPLFFEDLGNRVGVETISKN